MTGGIVTPTTNMWAAASEATVSGHRRRPTRRAAPEVVASAWAHQGALTPSRTPTLRTSSSESSPRTAATTASQTSLRLTSGRGRCHGSSIAKKSAARRCSGTRVTGIPTSLGTAGRPSPPPRGGPVGGVSAPG